MCAGLLATTALMPVGQAAAQSSKVGVTSATDGDPLGKPPTENERVLRIGIDVQANEIVTTKANDRAHLVFLDGTSLTVGPNARLTIDKFVYDPNTKTGDLAVTATQGVFRLVGGKISKNNPITINTPASTIGIRGGITMFSVNQKGTMAAFLFGHNMTVTGTGNGVTQNALRPGSVVNTNIGAPPSPPTLLPPGGLTSLVNALENPGSSSSGGSGSGGTGSGSGGSGADQKAASSQLPGTNSASSQAQAPPSSGPTPAPGGGGPPTQINNAVANAISNTNPAANNPQSVVQTSSSTTPAAPTMTSGTQQGYIGGIVERSGRHGTVLTNTVGGNPANLAPAPDLTITRNASTSTVTATVIILGLDGSVSSPNATLNLGTGFHGTSFFNDDVTFSTGTKNGRGTLGGREIRNTTGFATASAVNQAVSQGVITVTPQPFTGAGSCTCDFLTFGYWETKITQDNGHFGDHHHHHHSGQTDIVTQAPWVTGQVVAANNMPLTGTATFTGAMYGQAQDGANAALRNVGGSFTDIYNFGSRSGTVAATFDGRGYAGSIGASGATSFIGNLNSITTTGYNGTFAGSFNSSAGQAPGAIPAGQSGKFGITGPSGYIASGVFGTAVVPGSVH